MTPSLTPSPISTPESYTPPTANGVVPTHPLEPSTSSSSVNEHHHNHHMHIPFLHHNHNHSPPLSSSSDRHKSPSLLNELLHPIQSHKSHSDTNLPKPGSIASDKNNYMSDEALAEDLEVEEMVERQDSIGSHHHRQDDGVGELNNRMGALLLPSREGINGHVPDSKHTSGSSTPSDQYALGPGNAVVPPPRGGIQYTADELISSQPKGRKKSSKQRFAERQVGKLRSEMVCR